MTEIVHKHSAGGLIINDGRILLINWAAPRNTYDFPKGTLEPGESIEQAAVREVFEETGYKTKIKEYIGQTYYEYDWVDGTHHKKKVDYFLLELSEDDFTIPKREEHETFENVWVNVTEAREYISKEIDKEIFDKALRLA